MGMTSKRFEYTASLDAAGTLYAEDAAPLDTPEGWTPDHLMLAAVVRCSLGSLLYHARRTGLALEGSGRAHGVVTRRESDERFAFVAVEVDLDVRDLNPRSFVRKHLLDGMDDEFDEDKPVSSMAADTPQRLPAGVRAPFDPEAT